MKKICIALSAFISITGCSAISDTKINTTENYTEQNNVVVSKYQIEDTQLCFLNLFQKQGRFKETVSLRQECDVNNKDLVIIEPSIQDSDILIEGWVLRADVEDKANFDEKTGITKNGVTFKGVFFLPELETCVLKETNELNIDVNFLTPLDDLLKKHKH